MTAKGSARITSPVPALKGASQGAALILIDIFWRAAGIFTERGL